MKVAGTVKKKSARPPDVAPRHGDRQLVTLRLSRSVHAAMIEATKKSGRSLTAEIEAAIADAIAYRNEAERLKKEPLAALSATIDGLAKHTSDHLEVITKLVKEILDQRQGNIDGGAY